MGAGILGFGGSDTSVNAPQFDQSGAAGSQSFGNSVQAKDSAKSIGANARYQEQGSVANQGNGKIVLPGGYDLSGVKGPITIQQSDPDLLRSIVQSNTDVAQGTVSGFGDLLAKTTEEQSDSTNKILAQIASQNQPQPQQINRYALYIALAVVAALVGIFSIRKKK
jgi:hypothetical protein